MIFTNRTNSTLPIRKADKSSIQQSKQIHIGQLTRNIKQTQSHIVSPRRKILKKHVDHKKDRVKNITLDHTAIDINALLKDEKLSPHQRSKEPSIVEWDHHSHTSFNLQITKEERASHREMY